MSESAAGRSPSGPNGSGYDPEVARAAAEAMSDEMETVRRPSLPLFEDLMAEVAAAKPDVVEGFHLRALKQITPNLLMQHQMVFTRVPVPVFGEAPRTQPHSSYNFGAIFLPSAQRPQTMVRADVDGDFNNNCRFSFDIKPWLVVKTQMQLMNAMGGMGRDDPSGFDLALQAQRDKWNAKVSIGTGGMYQANVLGQITRNIALGGEAFYYSVQRVSGYSLGGRATWGPHTIVGQWLPGNGSINVSWLRKYSDKVNLWSTLEISKGGGRGEATCTAGYDAAFRLARVRGSMDSQGVMRLTLEERLMPSLTLALSAEVDHGSRDHKFGIGVSFENAPA